MAKPVDAPPTPGERADVVRHHLGAGIRDRRDLARVVAAVAGEPWISKPVCHGHGAPFDLLAALFFVENSDVVALGPRGGWKTQTLAMANALDMVWKPGISIAQVAATREQASRGHAYTRAHLGSAALRLLGISATVTVNQSKIVLGNGSRLEILSGTTAGLNSPRTNVVRVDEAELLKPELLEELRLIPHSFNGHRRAIAYVSSRKERFGIMDELVNSKRYKHFLRLIFCWADVAERCDLARRGGADRRDVRVPNPVDADLEDATFYGWKGCLECALAPVCLGRLTRARGKVKIDDLIAEFTSVSPTAWAAQMGSQRPEVSDRVFRFSRIRNVAEAPYMPHLPVNVSVDFGGGEAATCALFYQEVPRGPVHVLAEYWRIGASIYEDIQGVERVADDLFPDAKWGICVADSQQPVLIAEWNGSLRKFHLRPVKKLQRKTEMITALSALIGAASGGVRWMVHPRCANHIRELETFRARDIYGRGRPDYARPKTDDSIDAACYAAISGASRHRYAPSVWNLYSGRSTRPAPEAPAGVLVRDEVTGALSVNGPALVGAVHNRLFGRMFGYE